jgi:uncharacterized protein YoxC
MEIAALIAAGAFLMLVLVLAVPILRLRHTVDAATSAINSLNERTAPLLANATTTVENVNVALSQMSATLDGVNLQLEKVDAVTGHVQQVTGNVANLSAIVSAAATNPLVKLAAFGYGVRKATAARRHAEQEREVRAELKQRRKDARRGRSGNPVGELGGGTGTSAGSPPAGFRRAAR